MEFGNVGSLEETYMEFSADGISYVVPLADIGQIVAEVPQDIPQIQLREIAGRGEGSIIFQDGAGLISLKVEQVTGLVHIRPSCQYELPSQARSAKNRWVAGVAFLESTESLCYLLDCGRLRECFLGVPA